MINLSVLVYLANKFNVFKTIYIIFNIQYNVEYNFLFYQYSLRFKVLEELIHRL